MKPVQRGLLLDFGSVISRSFFETREAFARELGLAPGSLLYTGPFGNPADELWLRMQKNELSEREYWNVRARELGERVGQAWDIQAFCRLYNRLPIREVIREETAALVRDCRRASRRVGILTNELELFHGKEWLARIELMADFDVVVDATHTKILKPDPRAYALAQAGMELPADHIVFIDDQKRNADGAAAAGMIAIHLDITDPRAALDAARAALAL